MKSFVEIFAMGCGGLFYCLDMEIGVQYKINLVRNSCYNKDQRLFCDQIERIN